MCVTREEIYVRPLVRYVHEAMPRRTVLPVFGQSVAIFFHAVSYTHLTLPTN